MNIVSAWGSDPQLNKLAEDVVNFCIEKLMPKMKTLDICIEMSDDIDVKGYCMAVDKREFVIEVDSTLEVSELVETVCHEMVHVKQYARGELAIDGKQQYKTIEEYMDLWYEKEAYALEGELAIQFLERIEA